MEGEGESEVKEERGRGEDRMKGPSGQGSRHSNTGSRRGYSHLGQREPTGVCNCACVCVHSRADSDHLEQTASGASASAHARVCVPARCVRPVFGASEAERHVEYVASALSVSVEAYEAPSDQCWFFQVTAFWLAEEPPSFLFSSLLFPYSFSLYIANPHASPAFVFLRQSLPLSSGPRLIYYHGPQKSYTNQSPFLSFFVETSLFLTHLPLSLTHLLLTLISLCSPSAAVPKLCQTYWSTTPNFS